MFGRRRNDPAADPISEDTAPALPRLNDTHPVWDQPGPRDASEVDYSVGYLDMGALQIPQVPGMQIHLRMSEDRSTIQAVMMVLQGTAVVVSAVAAPASGGVWDEVRSETMESFRAAGATCEEVDGPYGTELRVEQTVTAPNGTQATVERRVIGHEGRGWVTRIDIEGPGAVDATMRAAMEQIINRLVVVRGSNPMPRFYPLNITMPKNMTPAGGAHA